MSGSKKTRFLNYMATADKTQPLLPLVHTTDGWTFEEKIFANLEPLKLTPCQFMNKDLLYLFYGRPTYKPNSDVQNTPLEAFHSVCFLLDNSTVMDISNIYPFDTGAFQSDIYADYLTPSMELKNFDLSNDISNAVSLVDKIYGSNLNYFMGQPKETLDTGCPSSVKAYHALANSKGASIIDARKSSIEIQASSHLDLRKSKVLAVVLPEQMLDQKDIKDFIEVELEAEAIGYFIICSSPREDMIEIMRVSREFYKRRGLL